MIHCVMEWRAYVTVNNSFAWHVYCVCFSTHTPNENTYPHQFSLSSPQELLWWLTISATAFQAAFSSLVSHFYRRVVDPKMSLSNAPLQKKIARKIQCVMVSISNKVAQFTPISCQIKWLSPIDEPSQQLHGKTLWLQVRPSSFMKIWYIFESKI